MVIGLPAPTVEPSGFHTLRASRFAAQVVAPFRAF
jgi:hypothetical protein